MQKSTIDRPQKIVTKRFVTAHCTPPGVSGIPKGVEGYYWQKRDLYTFRHYKGYSSAIPGKFVQLSSAFDSV